MKGKFKIVFLILTFSLFLCSIQAQNYRKTVREGNMSYKSGKYGNSEVSYLKALNKSKNPSEAAFNLGDAFYKQKKYNEAEKVFGGLSHTKTSESNLAKVYHNEGNTLLQMKKYEESLKAYKNALRLNPKDNQTRYNLAYVQAKLKQNNDKNKNKNKNKNNKNNKDNKNNNQNKPKPNPGKGKQPNQPPPQPKISKDDAQRMLESLQNDEKNTQQRLKENAAKAGKSSTLKNW